MKFWYSPLDVKYKGAESVSSTILLIIIMFGNATTFSNKCLLLITIMFRNETAFSNNRKFDRFNINSVCCYVSISGRNYRTLNL